MEQEQHREMMIQQSDDFSFPTIADHSSPDFTASLWCSLSGKVAVSDGSADQEEDFEFKPKTHLRKDHSSMDRLWEDGDGADKIDGLRKEIGSCDSTRSLPCHGTAKYCIGEDGGKSFLEEEKMDMLWEDFNDELSENSENIGGGARSGFETTIDSDSDFDGPEMGEFCCAQALKISKGSGLPFRRNNFLVILKVLKKLFLIHNSHLSHKN